MIRIRKKIVHFMQTKSFYNLQRIPPELVTRLDGSGGRSCGTFGNPTMNCKCRKCKKKIGSGGIRTHASEETGALNQRLRPLGHAT